MKLIRPTACNNKGCHELVIQKEGPGRSKLYCSRRCRWKCLNIPKLRRIQTGLVDWS